MDRDRFLLVLGMDATRWAKRYGIQPRSAACFYCGEKLVTSVPFAFESFRGLVAPTCPCGNVYTPYCVVNESRGKAPFFTGQGAARTSSPSATPRTLGRAHLLLPPRRTRDA
jgi:hypothetical protein